MISATLNTSLLLSILSSDGNGSLFPRVRIYNSSGGLEATLAATHISNGLYQVTWVPSTEGYFNYVAQFFTNVGFTLDAGYDRIGDLIDVNTIKNQLVRIL